MWIIIAIIIAINGGKLKTIQMTLDENLVEEIDKVVKKLGTTRSAFARERGCDHRIQRNRGQTLEPFDAAGICDGHGLPYRDQRGRPFA